MKITASWQLQWKLVPDVDCIANLQLLLALILIIYSIIKRCWLLSCNYERVKNIVTYKL